MDLSTEAGRNAARAAGYWVGTDSSGQVVAEPNHPSGQANQSGSSSGGGSATNTADAVSSAPASNGGAPVYQTVNGPKTVAQMEAELRAVGWGGPAGGVPLGPGSIANAYASTSKGDVTEMSGQNYGGAAQNQTAQQGAAAAVPQRAVPLGDSIDKLLAALASGNQAAAKEAAREFDATFGLDKDKFSESIRQYNQNFGLQQANVTGTYNGEATLAKQKQDADMAAQAAGLTGFFNGTKTLAREKQESDLSGTWNGAPTESAREFDTAEAEKAREYNSSTGLDAEKLEASLQADPFRQQQVINGLNTAGYSKAIDALNGIGNQPAFQAPTGSAADTRSLAYLSGRNGASGSPLFNAGSAADGAQNYDNSQYAASLAALPDANKIVARNFLKEDPESQQFALSALSAKNGLSMDENKYTINSTLPKFSAPTGMVTSD